MDKKKLASQINLPLFELSKILCLLIDPLKAALLLLVVAILVLWRGVFR